MKFSVIIIAVAVVIVVVFSLSNRERKASTPGAVTNRGGMMRITSSAFAPNAPIPATYTCNGRSINPDLKFIDIPSTAKSLALIVHDPDAPRAGGFYHWVAWNIAVATTGVAEGESLPGIVGKNDAGQNAYLGPCPPSGTHRYVFRLYALDASLSLPTSTTGPALLKALDGHVVDQAELIGTYRQP